MKLYILVTAEMTPVPDDIKVLGTYGSEAIVAEGSILARGDVMFVEGSDEGLSTWLRPFDGVWISMNPMLGHWDVVHVR